jgi:MFS family permease
MDQPVSTPVVAADGKGDFTPRVIWTLAMLGIFLGFNLVDRGLLALNLEPIKQELHASDTQMSFATGIAYFLFNGIAAVPLARLADRYSRRTIIGVGFGFYSLVMGLTGLVSSFGQLLTARIVLGVGEASTAGTSPMVNDLVSPGNRRTALAGIRVFSAIVVMGMMTGLGHLAEVYGWRASFFALAVPAALLVPLMLYTVYEPPHERALGGIKPKASMREIWASWRKSPAFMLVLFGFALGGVTLQANGAWAGAYMARVRGMSPSEIGMLSGIARGPALLAGSLIAGWITDRLARRDHRWRFWVPGIMLIVGTPMEFLYLNLPSHIGWMTAYIITGALIMGSQACAIALLMDVSGPGARATGLAFGLLLMGLLADFFGPTGIGVMNDTIFKSHGPDALRYSMAIVACSAALGGALLLFAARYETEETRSG